MSLKRVDESQKDCLSIVKVLPDQATPKHRLRSGRWKPVRRRKGVPNQTLSSPHPFSSHENLDCCCQPCLYGCRAALDLLPL